MTDIAVSDTGPLISLEKMKDGYGFIRRLYRKIIVPPAVIHEVSRGKYPAFQDYLSFYGAEDLIESVQPFPTVQIPEIKRLQIGEAEAICLALQFQCPLLIEETLGRKIALLAGLKVCRVDGGMAFKGELV